MTKYLARQRGQDKIFGLLFWPSQSSHLYATANGDYLWITRNRRDGMQSRLDALQEGARVSGFTIDFLDHLTAGLSLQAARKVIGNASSMPSNMKSSDNPYVRRSARAPSSDSR